MLQALLVVRLEPLNQYGIEAIALVFEETDWREDITPGATIEEGRGESVSFPRRRAFP
jgi:hypothetical protein